MRFKLITLLTFIALNLLAAEPPYVRWRGTTNAPSPNDPAFGGFFTNGPSGPIGWYNLFGVQNTFGPTQKFNNGINAIYPGSTYFIQMSPTGTGFQVQYILNDLSFAAVLLRFDGDTVFFQNATGSGTFTGDGTGLLLAPNPHLGWLLSQDGFGDNIWSLNLGAGPATNLTIVSSVDIPMGAWFTNGIDNTIGPTISPASPGSISYMGDGMIFYHTNGTTAVTNVARTRFSLPWDFNQGTVKVGIYSVCSSTNSSAATNIVYGVRAVAVGGGDNLTNVTWGAFVRTVGNVGTNAFVQGSGCTTAALTIGNSPDQTKGIVWEIQRWGGDASDTETNFNCFVAQVRVYYQRNTRVDFPATTP